MIAWLNPIALAGLAAVAGPVLVHLLRRQRARRIPFPSLRFLESTRTAAARLSRPSDLLLLLVRLAIVAGAVLALAQPVVMTAARRQAWERRVQRVIVLDTSPSMSADAGTARESAESMRAGAEEAAIVEAGDLRAGIAHAVTALARMGPGRHEVVVVSDFQLGSVDAAALAVVPAHAGIRFVPIGQPVAERTIEGDLLIGAPGIPPRQQHITLRHGVTQAELRPPMSSAGGLVLIAPQDQRAQVDRLRRSIARAGAPEPPPGRPVTVVFAGGEEPASVGAIAPGWMLRATLSIRQDPVLSGTAASFTRREAADPGDRWTVVASDARQAPVAWTAAGPQGLLVRVAATPADFVAAAAVRAALFGVRGPEIRSEQEIARIPPARLDEWRRDPGTLPVDRRPPLAPGDARWFWSAVLLLLGLEHAVRRERRAAIEERARAA